MGEARCNELVVQAYGISSDQSNAMLSDNPHSGIYEAETSRTLDCNGGNPVCNQGGIAVVSYAIQGNMIGRKDENGSQGDGVNAEVSFTLNTVDRHAVCCAVADEDHCHPSNPAYSVRCNVNTEVQKEVTPALMARDYKDAAIVGQPAYCMTVGGYGHVAKEKTPTLEARGYKDPPVVGEPDSTRAAQYKADYLVRRLTTLECCRLQGYPDGWTENLGTASPTDEEIHKWSAVFENWARIQGKTVRPPSRNRIIRWLKNPRSESAEYKAYGNSVAVPCVFFVLAGIVWAGKGEKQHE